MRFANNLDTSKTTNLKGQTGILTLPPRKIRILPLIQPWVSSFYSQSGVKPYILPFLNIFFELNHERYRHSDPLIPCTFAWIFIHFPHQFSQQKNIADLTERLGAAAAQGDKQVPVIEVPDAVHKGDFHARFPTKIWMFWGYLYFRKCGFYSGS